jgi:hypothetical protein
LRLATDNGPWCAVRSARVEPSLTWSRSLASTVGSNVEVGRWVRTRATGGNRCGRPLEGKHLLSGFIVCECRARFEAAKGYCQCSVCRRPGVPDRVRVPSETEIEHTFLPRCFGRARHCPQDPTGRSCTMN